MLSGPDVPVPAPVLACDLDETLLRVNTFPAFVRFAFRRALAERDVVALAWLAGAVVRRKLLGGSHVAFKAGVHAVGQRLTPAAMAAWASSMVASHLNAEVYARVTGWPGGTVLVTAAPAVYAELIGGQLGFTLVQASGHRAGAYVENVHTRKAEHLQAVLSGPLACAMSDDPLLDGPLLAMAEDPLVVDGAGMIRPYVGPAHI